MDSCTHSHAHIHMHTCASAEAQNTETSCCSVEIIALCWAGGWLGCMGRSQMYSAFIMLKHFNLGGKKCHFTLSALINRAFPPPCNFTVLPPSPPNPHSAHATADPGNIFYPHPQPSSTQDFLFLKILNWFQVSSDLMDIAFVSFQFLALGTHFGKVFLLDIQGNTTQKFEIVSGLKCFGLHLLIDYM